MRLFRIFFDERFIHLTNKYEVDVSYIGRSLSTAQNVDFGERKIELTKLLDGARSSLHFADFPGYASSGILARKTTKELIEPHLTGLGQWVPMFYGDEQLYYVSIQLR